MKITVCEKEDKSCLTFQRRRTQHIEDQYLFLIREQEFNVTILYTTLQN